MADLESELKLKNWLSILTFDAFKYATAGGELLVEETGMGLVLTLPGIALSSDGVNKKFLRLVSEGINGRDSRVASEPEKETT